MEKDIAPKHQNDSMTEKSTSKVDSHTKKEIDSYTSWVEKILQKRNLRSPDQNVLQGMKDGYDLLHNLEVLSGESLKIGSRSSKPFNDIRNIDKALTFVESKEKHRITALKERQQDTKENEVENGLDEHPTHQPQTFEEREVENCDVFESTAGELQQVLQLRETCKELESTLAKLQLGVIELRDICDGMESRADELHQGFLQLRLFCRDGSSQAVRNRSDGTIADDDVLTNRSYTSNSATAMYSAKSKPETEIMTDCSTCENPDYLLTQQLTWNGCLQRKNVPEAKELIKQRMTPNSYSQFKKAIHLLSSEKIAQRDLCKLMCDALNQHYVKAEKIYAVFDRVSNQESETPYFVAMPFSDAKTIKEYPLLSKNISAYGDEDRRVREKEIEEKKRFLTREAEKKMNAAVRRGQRCFCEWPNFSRISHSFYRSKNCQTGERNILEPKECIVLYVYVKGWIPIGWGPFPQEFEGYDVDVRECMPIEMFHTSVNSEMLLSLCGTLQSPVPGETNQLLALTAGHVILSADEIKDIETKQTVYTTKKSEGFLQIKEDSDICIAFGNVRIDGGDDEDDEAFADVAVVQLKSPLEQKLLGTHWDELGFKRHPKFADPTEQCIDVFNDDIVLKYGESTKVTLGRVQATCGGYGRRLDMIEVESYDKNKKFSERGDSGAYMYVINKDILKEHNTNGPIEPVEYDKRFTEGKDAFLIGIIHGGHTKLDITYCTKIRPNLAGLRGSTN